MILGSILALLKNNLSRLQRFNYISMKYIFILVEFIHRIFYFLRTSFAKHQTKFGLYQFQSFLSIVVIVISILLKTTFPHTSIHSQLLVKIL